MKELFIKYFRDASSYQSIDPTCFNLEEYTETWLINNKQQLTLGGVGCSLTDKKAINLLNELNKYATDFDYEFGLPLYDDIKFIDGYKGKQPIDELKDIVKKYIKV